MLQLIALFINPGPLANSIISEEYDDEDEDRDQDSDEEKEEYHPKKMEWKADLDGCHNP